MALAGEQLENANNLKGIYDNPITQKIGIGKPALQPTDSTDWPDGYRTYDDQYGNYIRSEDGSIKLKRIKQ